MENNRLSKQQKELLVNVLKKACDNGEFLYWLDEKELKKDVNIADKLIDTLIRDYKLDWNKKIITINIREDDLNNIKFGIDKIYEILNKTKILDKEMVNKPETKDFLDCELYDFMYEKLKFDEIKINEENKQEESDSSNNETIVYVEGI